MIAHPEKINGRINQSSPNFTISGRHQRFWYKADGALYLLHGPAKKKMDEYKIAGKDGIVSEKSYVILAGNVYAAEVSRTNTEIERISFEDYYSAVDTIGKSKAKGLQICCEHFGIPNWKDFISQVCEVDEKTGNESRELSDIGVLRNAKTLEIIGFDKL